MTRLNNSRTGFGTTTISSVLVRYLDEHCAGGIVDESRAGMAINRMRRSIGLVLVGPGVYQATARYAKERTNKDGVTTSTVRRELSVLNAALRWAVKVGMIAYAPPVFKAKSGEVRKRILTDQEENQLLMAAAKYGNWMLNLVILLLMTGQRVEAVLSLEWERVDFSDRVIYFTDPDIPHAERRKGRGTVPINDDLYRHLMLMAKWNEQTNYDGENVIHKDDGKRITAIYNQWNKMCDDAGLVGVTPHVLRHSVATKLVNMHEDIYKVSKMLGHSSVRTTEQVYVKHNHEPLRGTVNKLKLAKEAQ